MKSYLQFFFGLVVACLFGLLLLFLWNDPQISKEFLLGVVSACITVFGWIYSHRKEKEKENAARLFSQKAQSYNKVFETVGGLLAADKIKSKKISDKQLLEHIFEIKNDFLVWGSEETIAAFEKITNVSANNDSRENTKLMMKCWGDLYLAMRKDLGHKDIKMTAYDIIGFYLDSEAKKELRGK